ncbi:MAG: ABC transporter permease [Marinifilaceae bacterium]
MSGIDKIFIRELRRIRESKSLMFGCVYGPLFSFILVIAIFYKGMPEDLPVAIVDQDNSTLSNKINAWIDATSIAESTYKLSNLTDAKILMEEGKVDAIVYMPKNLERDVLKGVNPELPVFFNNTNIVKGSLLYKGIFTCLSTVKAGLKMKVRTKKSYSQAELMPSVRPIPFDVHLLYNPYTSYMYFVGMAVLAIMLIAFSMLTTVFALGTEIRWGTSYKLMKITNGHALPALLGKLLPYTFIFILHALIIDFLIFGLLKAPLHGSLLTIIVSQIFLVFTYQSMAVLLISLTANLRLCLSLGAAYTMMALSFSGLTFPAMGMPLIAKLFSYLFPYTYYLKIFISQSVKNIDLSIALYDLIPMLVFIALGILVSGRIKHIFTEEKYWGKR